MSTAVSLRSASESLHGHIPLATSVALRTSDASRSDNRLGVAVISKQLSSARYDRVRSSVAKSAKCRSAVDEDHSSVEGCERVAAIMLRVRPLGKKSPRLCVRVGDDSFPTTRVHCHMQEAVSTRKQGVLSRSWKGLRPSIMKSRGRRKEGSRRGTLRFCDKSRFNVPQRRKEET
jgi:hypothetical protein